MTDSKFPKRVVIRDEGVTIDGRPFLYEIADPAVEGFELVEAADDHMAYLVLKVMMPMGSGSDRVDLVDFRTSQTERRRKLAATWYGGWVEAQNHDSGSTPATFITSDHELGMAWRGGFNHGYTSDEQGWRENPYIIPGVEFGDGVPRP